MRTTELLTLSLILVFTLCIEVAAQNLSSVAPGDRIRVALSTDRHHKRTAIFASLSSDAIVVRSDKSRKSVKVPFAAISSLEVYRGTKRKTWAGAGIGLIVGAVAGGAIGSAIGNASDPEFAGLHAAAGVIIGTPAGFLLGAVVGSQIKIKQWEEVPLGAND